MPSAEQIEARKAKARERMETIKGLLLAHQWVFKGESAGYERTFLPRGVPDRAENMVTELVGVGHLKFRRGEQFARVGFQRTKFWRQVDGQFRDQVQVLNTDLAKIQQVLHERSPRKE